MPSKLNQLLCYTFVFIIVVMSVFQIHQTRLLKIRETHKRSSTVVQSSITYDQDTQTPNHLSIPNNSYSKSITNHLPNFPHGDIVKSDVLNAPWVASLRTLLKNRPKKQLNLVVSDAKFQTNLLNWLIAALVRTKPPLENVIVLSFDYKLQVLLKSKDIPSVYIDYHTVVHKRAKMQTKHSHIWITRTTVYRLLSSWGYDIAIYDTDAIILKNPQPLFDAHSDSDIIGSAGGYPFMLGEKWGVTFCMGFALFRHTPRTELLWEALSNTRNFSQDDQVKLNYALDECNINWLGPTAKIMTEAVEGKCADNKLGGMRVTILPHSAICRKTSGTCSPLYYIWHGNSKKDSRVKVRVAKAENVWFLREDWKSSAYTVNRLTGTEWLSAISTT